MKKIVTWDNNPELQKNFVGGKKPTTFKELWARGQAVEQEHLEAQAYLQKANPVMVALLEYKLRHRHPLVVMRPFSYQTSEIVKGDAVDDAFYNKRADDGSKAKFTDVNKVVYPGTQLMLKSLDMTLQEFIFEDASGNEHAINFSDRDKLMTSTTVFEEAKKYLEIKGE